MTIDRLHKNFEILSDWQERYRYIIELGCKMPKLDEIHKTEENRVHGCISTIHMVVELTDEKPAKIKLRAESDSSIVNGLIAILGITYNGLTLKELPEIDIKEIFAKLGLDRHISPNRRNGFFAMVERIQQLTD